MNDLDNTKPTPNVVEVTAAEAVQPEEELAEVQVPEPPLAEVVAAEPEPAEAQPAEEPPAEFQVPEPPQAEVVAAEPEPAEEPPAEFQVVEPAQAEVVAAEPEPAEAQPAEEPPAEFQVPEPPQAEVVAAEPEPAEMPPDEPKHPMDTEIAAAYDYKKLKSGQILDGIIVSKSPTEILVDVGTKSEGFVRGRELEQMDKELLAGLKVGGDVLVYVVRPQDRQGNLILSLRRAQQEQDWREAERLFEAKDTVERKVIGTNRGGLIVEMGKVRGFAPASQLAIEYHDQRPPKAEGAEGAARWVHLVGKELRFKIIELDRKRNRLILSERLAMREWRRAQKEQLLQDLRRGDIRKGRVTSLTNFGAFVDLGGADGLIHLSEISWGQVGHPNEVLELAQEVEVFVLKVDHKRKRIALSLRQLQPEPWAVVHENYAVGQLVEGNITNLTDFGAFARVGPGIEGLIHISELADQRVNHPREVVKTGQTLTLRIIRIDPQRRRMALSLKQAPEEEYVEFDWREASDEVSEDEEPLAGHTLDLEEARAELEAQESAEAEPEAEAVEAEPAAEEVEAEAEPEPEAEAVEAEPVAEEVEAEAGPEAEIAETDPEGEDSEE